MRKHLSVFMLIARSSVYKLFLVMLGMAAAEIALVALVAEAKTLLLFQLVESSRIYFVYIVAVALTVIFSLGACSMGSAHPRYTLARLSVSYKVVMLWHWLYSALALLALWMWQAILLYGISLWHHSVADAGYISHQSIFLSSFQSNFFHSVLPLDDFSRLMRNIVMVLAMGGVCATGAHKIRRGQTGIFAAILLIGIFGAAFRSEHFAVNNDGFLMFVFALVLVISLYGVFAGDAEVDHEETATEN